MPSERDFHSEEVQQIMGRLPSWILRWGITVILAIFAGIIAGCYVIKYPEIITAPVVITTVNSLSDLVARYDGLINKLYVANDDKVRKGDIIAVSDNTADFEAVYSLADNLKG